MILRILSTPSNIAFNKQTNSPTMPQKLRKTKSDDLQENYLTLDLTSAGEKLCKKTNPPYAASGLMALLFILILFD